MNILKQPGIHILLLVAKNASNFVSFCFAYNKVYSI